MIRRYRTAQVLIHEKRSRVKTRKQQGFEKGVILTEQQASQSKDTTIKHNADRTML